MQVFLILMALSQFVKAAGITEADLAQRLRFYASIQELKVSFHQIKHLKDLKVDLKSEGELRLRKPDQVRWEILKPSHLIVEIDREKVQLREGQGPVQTFEIGKMSKENAARGLSLLMPWLTLDVKALSEQYRIESPKDRQFVFVPKVESKVFRQMTVGLNLHGHLERLQLDEVSGDSLEIVFGTPQVKKREVK